MTTTASRLNITFFVVPILVLMFLAPAPGSAQNPTKGTGLPLPRFVSLRADEVNMRAGPGVRYPVDWVYRRQSLPVEVIAEFGTWRKVRDVEGTQGWVHRTMLSNRRMITVIGETRALRRKGRDDSPAIARVEANVVGRLLECPDGGGWCRLEIAGFTGWLKRGEFWGIYPAEAVR